MAAPLWKTLTRQRWPLLQSSLSTSGYQEEPALETELKGFWRPLEIVCSVSCCVVNQNGCHHFHSYGPNLTHLFDASHPAENIPPAVSGCFAMETSAEQGPGSRLACSIKRPGGM
ncbi:zinc finger protein ZIC 4 isoform X4 [Alosa sapidissima]|uniref:zinc finger protein ZIC 4 isoform X4 n=1 Tax=Alosa sapidissima TaxID=34773 RepID=UPI001C0873C0|nr:zinc finger protein ZIC 4 isoform X4 [Alosa sapidissima]